MAGAVRDLVTRPVTVGAAPGRGKTATEDDSGLDTITELTGKKHTFH